MSNLGSYGSADYESPQQQAEQQSALVSPDDPHAQALLQINQCIQSPHQQDHDMAMKMLLAMMSKGIEVSQFFAFVVQQVASNDAVSRQLAYVYLNHYAEEDPDTAILSINTFQRSLSDSDPLVRASALKVMSSIRSKEILPAIQSAVNQVIGDPSPYVKKAAAFAMIKASEMEPQEIPNYLPLIGYLLGDSSPIAFSGAIAAYWALSPDNIDLLHPHFRSICENITKLDEYAQVFTLRSLTVYSRYCFKNPELEENNDADVNFWDETGNKDQFSADQLLLIHATKQLLSSPNSAVVMAAVSLLFNTAPSAHISTVARPLVRLLYDGPTSSQVALTTILTVANVYNHIFVPHINHFFVRKSEPTSVKQLKLRVLALLATPSNASMVLNELSGYTGSPDIDFAATAVKTMGKTSMCNPIIIPQCLGSLLRLMNRAEGTVLSEVVLVIAHILRQKRGTDDEAQALRQLCRKFLVIKDADARAAVLSIVGDMHETHPEFAPQLLRHIALYYLNEPAKVRLQALTLAAKLIACGIDSQVPNYVLKIGERDSEFDIRDRARFLLALLKNTADDIRHHLKQLLFPVRQNPLWSNAADGIASNQFQIGTFSHYFNRAFSGYEPLPDWAPEDELPDESVRAQVKVLPDGTKMTSLAGDDDDTLDINDWFNQKDDNDGEEDASDYYSDKYSSYSYSYSEEEQAAADDAFGFFD
ncbi:Adaptin N terminal region family protein [Tritrichomonas foetus]|uniref:Adaptin N terminal region family protein n=1 Tax=Tritrichomonas foetus TaxID=1144522 RepID=A0A1J4JHC3_9EUKA|nr:Adaptin N terminal region family protein [Tritrichomonas foetus]|eukprot:OHS98534.1 Adaptin N terminal region family protein [Tritrichomonas foetus]